MSGRDYRDDVIEELAASEAALGEQVAALAERAALAEADRDEFRLVAVQAIHRLHDTQAEIAKLTGPVSPVSGARAGASCVDPQRKI